MASRYDAIIATLVGLCALCVSGYTAYMQRQQVRAAVWPILQFNSSNAPEIHFTLANKGVGPAIIQHVVVKVDDQPVRNWHEALNILLGPGEHHGSESDMNGSVLAAGESMIVLAPFDSQGKPFASGKVRCRVGQDEQSPRARQGRDLLLLGTRRMLDSACERRFGTQQHGRRSLSNFVGG
jgi:hypothetical protein